MANHHGPSPITPEQRIILMNADQWEDFILECCEQLRIENKYLQVKKLGGTGDKGRDIAAYLKFPPEAGEWDMYQAKAYQSPLTPSNLLADLAKLIFNVFVNTYTMPRNYYICGTKDVGTTLFTMLEHPEKLRDWLVEKWKDKDGNFVTFKQKLTPKLEAFIQTFDVKVIKEMKVSSLLSIHSRSSKHWSGFGVLPSSVAEVPVPDKPAKEEQVYVTEILRAYEDCEKCKVSSVEEIPHKHNPHFENCRRQFYYAEGLNRFSRDFVPEAFDSLLKDVRVGISPVVDDATHPDGLKRLNETLKHATTLTATTNPLKDRIRSTDLQGACHHLANNGEVKWVPDE